MTEPIEPMNEEIERILAAYADARLAPDPQRTATTRARILREAEFAFAAARDATAARAAQAAERRARWKRFGVRYGILAAALSLSVVFAGATLASEAGDPLYGVRVWWENAMLPAGADARAIAEIDRLDTRVLELTAAVESGDGHGAAAAAAAYQAIVDEAVRGAAGDDQRAMLLEDALSRHVVVLTALLEKVPDSARGAIEHAIGQSGKALEKIGTPPKSNGGEAPGNAGKSPRPDRTPKPGGSQGGPGG